MTNKTTFARRVFRVAAIYGLLALLPQYLLEHRLVPPTNHPEHFYGFIGVAAAWQLAFLLIASDPVRFRPLMPVTVVEKLVFGVPAIVLFAQGRIDALVLGAGLIDLVLGILFAAAWMRTPAASVERTAAVADH